MPKVISWIIFFSINIMLIFSCHSAPAVSEFTIVEPPNGSVFYPGDRVTFRAVSAPSEKPSMVFLRAINMPITELFTAEPYAITFTIPSTFTGKDTLKASAKFADEAIIEKAIEINVILPPNIVLKGISVDPTFILLKKLPQGSEPNDIRISETEDISVGGIYSDGIKRNISSASDGTAYLSSDEKVVTVDSEGNVKAQGVGNATITVRSGQRSATVKVIVKPFK